MELDSKEVKETYSKILKKNGIHKEIKEVVITEPASLIGEHMASVCQHVTIKFSDNSKDLEFFIKKFVSNPFSDIINEMGLFHKEATFFNDLLPKAKEYCVKKTGSDKLIEFFPKSYYGDESLLVLENLTQQGYFMLDKVERQSFEQAKMVLANMAKLHGVFYAMIGDMGVQDFATKYPYAVKDAFLSDAGRIGFAPMFKNNLNTVIKLLEVCKTEGSERTVTWLKQYMVNIYDHITDIIQNSPDEQLLVLNHGDCWNNNIMFLKNEETGEILNPLFIDMQVTRYGSPNLDIGYFLFTSVKSEDRREKLIPLLKYYFDSLQETVKQLGTSIIYISFNDFVENYKKKCGLGFWMGLVFMAGIEAMKDVDLQKAGDNLEEINKYFAKIILNWSEANPEEAKKSCKDVIETVKEYITLTN